MDEIILAQSDTAQYSTNEPCCVIWAKNNEGVSLAVGCNGVVLDEDNHLWTRWYFGIRKMVWVRSRQNLTFEMIGRPL